MIFRVKFNICRTVQIIEMGDTVHKCWVFGLLEHPVGIGAASTDQETAVFLCHKWPFNSQSTINQSNTTIYTKVLWISFFCLHVHYRRDSFTISCWNTPFKKCHIFYRIGIDHGEEPEQMGRIENRCPIQKNQVLVGVPTADVKSRCHLPNTLNTRHHHHTFDQVRLAHQYR